MSEIIGQISQAHRAVRAGSGSGDGGTVTRTVVVRRAFPAPIEVRLAPGDGAETVLELAHTAVVDPEFWDRYGPGAVGVGWDLALLGLFLYLSTGQDRPDDPAAWATSPDAREFITRSSEAWGVASGQAGASEGEAAAAVAETTAFYLPPLPGGGPDAPGSGAA
ncbi:MAG: hypothetical protein ACRDN1_10445 [Trebonia sp.]